MLKKSIHSIVVLLVVLSGVFTLNTVPANAADPPRHALVLYDYDQNVEYGKLGQAYAIMLRNLLGHFQEMSVDMGPVQDYQSGDIEAHDITFYLGSYYDNPLVPSGFLEEVMSTGKTVVWFKYNFWKLVWSSYYTKTITDDQGNQTYVWTNGFQEKFGFTYNTVRGLNSTPSAENPTPGFFDTVLYKNKSMIKYYSFDSENGIIYADPDVVQSSISDPAKASQLVTVSNSGNMEALPYIIQADNFWFVADMPFTFIGPRDRYLVICDILHDMVGINHAENHKALVRLEDVGALVNPDNMKTLVDYLDGEKIPFSIAVSPFYRDPLGTYNDGVPQEIHLQQANDLKKSLKYAEKRGGAIVMHGYTHQYDAMINPWTGASFDDYEFWNIIDNSPVAEDSKAWALDRIDRGMAEFQGEKFEPFAWETPHYHGSPASYRAVAERFDVTYQRVVYHTSDNPNLNPNNPLRDVEVGQFFPYVIYEDYYGQMIIPENLGNIEYILENDPSSSYNYTAEDILANAEYNKIIRDGIGSFFFHPFWLDPDINVPGMEDFVQVIEGMSQLGYQWEDPRSLSTRQ